MREGRTHDFTGVEPVGHGEDRGRARCDELYVDITGISEAQGVSRLDVPKRTVGIETFTDANHVWNQT